MGVNLVRSLILGLIGSLSSFGILKQFSAFKGVRKDLSLNSTALKELNPHLYLGSYILNIRP